MLSQDLRLFATILDEWRITGGPANPARLLEQMRDVLNAHADEAAVLERVAAEEFARRVPAPPAARLVQPVGPNVIDLDALRRGGL